MKAPCRPALSTLLWLLPCTACATGPEERWYVEGAYLDRELGEVTSDVVVSGLGVVGEVDVPDLPQERVGVRTGVRSPWSEWHLQFFAEEFGEALDLFGFGYGASGLAPFGAGEGPRFGLLWGTDVALVAGGGDVAVVDLGSGQVVGELRQDLVYLDVDLALGLGIDFDGLRPSAGIAANLLTGWFDTEEVGDGTLSGANVGPFLGLEYAAPDTPVVARLRLGFGDVDALSLGLGIQF
jgi:hypothetical protein